MGKFDFGCRSIKGKQIKINARPPKTYHILLGPAVFKDAFYFDLDCPLLGEGPDGHFPLKIDSVGSVAVRIRGVIDISVVLVRIRKVATKRPQTWSTEMILGAFYTISRA